MLVQEKPRVYEAHRWDGVSGPNDPATSKALCWQDGINHTFYLTGDGDGKHGAWPVPHVHGFGSPATQAAGTPIYKIDAGEWVVSHPEPGTYYETMNRVLSDAEFRDEFDPAP